MGQLPSGPVGEVESTTAQPVVLMKSRPYSGQKLLLNFTHHCKGRETNQSRVQGWICQHHGRGARRSKELVLENKTQSFRDVQGTQ